MDKTAIAAVVTFSLLLLSLAFGFSFCGAAVPSQLPPEMASPSVPEFTVRLEQYPFDVPPVYEVDEYSGKTVMTQAGYHVDNQSVVVSIKKQPIQSTFNNTRYFLSFYVEAKGHFGENWTNFYRIDQPDAEYTTFSRLTDYPIGSQVDFRVEAVVTHAYEEWVPACPPWTLEGGYAKRNATDSYSKWSSIQTLTVPEPVSLFQLTQPTPTQTPLFFSEQTQAPEFSPTPPPNNSQANTASVVVVVGMVVSIVVVLMLVSYAVKHRGLK